ncbi:fimbria/pilus outer membrane usher protein, partial [Providencia alcalifaciens]
MPSYLFICLFVIPNTYAQDGKDYYFPSSLISIDAEHIADLSTFENQGSQLPGTYDVDVYLNGNLKYRRNMAFVKEQHCQEQHTHVSTTTDPTGLMPLLTKQDLTELGVNTETSAFTQSESDQCINIVQLIPNAHTEFDFPKMKLNISIPQIALSNVAKDEISTNQWDDGINALFTSYTLGITDNQYKHDFSKNIYLNLRNGINIGSWRYRDNRTWTRYTSKHNQESHWQYLNSYVERGIIPWRSRLVLGDSTTNNTVFDSLTFRGVQLRTDESMYPASQQGFSPIIRGVANSNATLEIRQNNYLIYQANVAPGEFAITDLNSLNSSGDLQVSILEANGDIQSFIVPYASVPVLLREGRMSYSLTAGEFRSDNSHYDTTQFGETTLIWGASSLTTLYGGIQYAQNYLSGAIGTGFNLGAWGAFSADITHANSQLTDGSRYQGQSLRFLYARAFPETGTNIQLTGYRYSTRGYYT